MFWSALHVTHDGKNAAGAYEIFTRGKDDSKNAFSSRFNAIRAVAKTQDPQQTWIYAPLQGFDMKAGQWAHDAELPLQHHMMTLAAHAVWNGCRIVLADTVPSLHFSSVVASARHASVVLGPLELNELKNAFDTTSEGMARLKHSVRMFHNWCQPHGLELKQFRDADGPVKNLYVIADVTLWDKAYGPAPFYVLMQYTFANNKYTFIYHRRNKLADATLDKITRVISTCIGDLLTESGVDHKMSDASNVQQIVVNAKQAATDGGLAPFSDSLLLIWLQQLMDINESAHTALLQKPVQLTTAQCMEYRKMVCVTLFESVVVSARTAPARAVGSSAKTHMDTTDDDRGSHRASGGGSSSSNGGASDDERKDKTLSVQTSHAARADAVGMFTADSVKYVCDHCDTAFSDTFVKSFAARVATQSHGDSSVSVSSRESKVPSADTVRCAVLLIVVHVQRSLFDHIRVLYTEMEEEQERVGEKAMLKNIKKAGVRQILASHIKGVDDAQAEEEDQEEEEEENEDREDRIRNTTDPATVAMLSRILEDTNLRVPWMELVKRFVEDKQESYMLAEKEAEAQDVEFDDSWQKDYGSVTAAVRVTSSGKYLGHLFIRPADDLWYHKPGTFELIFIRVALEKYVHAVAGSPQIVQDVLYGLLADVEPYVWEHRETLMNKQQKEKQRGAPLTRVCICALQVLGVNITKALEKLAYVRQANTQFRKLHTQMLTQGDYHLVLPRRQQRASASVVSSSQPSVVE